MVTRYGSRVSVACDVILAGDRISGKGLMLDVSSPGCLIECQQPVQVGDYVRLRVFLPDRAYPFDVPLAAVRWVEGGRMGLEFIRSSEADQARLAAFVQEHATAVKSAVS
jgi:PilZ domain